MKKLFLFLFLFVISYNLYSQNITNTLGTDGNFSIKDGSDTLLTLRQSDGLLNIKKDIRLEDSVGSPVGILYKGSDRFIHNYASLYSDGFNTFLGLNAGNFSLAGWDEESSYNTGVGYSSLSSITTGYRNTAVGTYSLHNNTGGSSNIAVGTYTLFDNTNGSYNTAVGNYSLFNNETGNSNTTVGVSSLYNNTTGYHNVAIGSSSLFVNTSGVCNTAVGSSSLAFNSLGNSNTAVGYLSLYWNSTGDSNTAIGYRSGSTITTGKNNTLIGFNAQPSFGMIDNEITLGDNQITALRCNVTTITAISDARDKKNIHDLSLGLDFITQLKPRQFNWDKREWYEDNESDGSKMEEELTAGFIAQELDEVQQSENAEWLNLVYKSNPEKLEATTGNLLPVMIKAIQELNDKNELLEKEIAHLKNEIESLKTVNEKLVELEKLMMEIRANENEIKEIKTSSN